MSNIQFYCPALLADSSNFDQETTHLNKSIHSEQSRSLDLKECACLSSLILNIVFSIHFDNISMFFFNWDLQTADNINRWSSYLE